MKKTFRIRNELLRTNLRKVIRYQGNKYTLGDLLRLLKEQDSFVKVSEITHIPYPRLYSILTKYFGKGINKIKKQVGFIKAKDSGYTYSLKKIVRLFKKYGFLPDVSKITGIPKHSLYGMLTKHFGMKLFEVRKKLGIRRSCLKRRDLEKNSSRYQQIKEAYERLGTLAKAGEEFHLTRERVRQILNQGEKRGVFIYELNREKRFREISQKYDRGSLIKEIRMLISPTRICMKLGIKISDFKKLLEYFTIEYKDYRLLAVMGKTAEKYSQIVDVLGHHPSTTEMNSRTDWRTVWGAIDRNWGNMSNFRKEFGIEIPKRRWPLKVQKRWKEQRIQKDRRIQEILELLKNSNGLSNTELATRFNIDSNSFHSGYIYKMLKSGLIRKIGPNSNARYIINAL